jgi:hypothetical protein
MRKRIFIYSPYWNTYGGGEKYLLNLSTVLSNKFDVQATLLSTAKGVDKASLEKFSNIDLSKVAFLDVSGLSQISDIVGPEDCFIFQSNVRKIVTNAKQHAQIVQIPYKKITPASIGLKLLKGSLRESVKDIYRLKLLDFAHRRANLVLTYSTFVQKVLNANYKIQSEVLHPPIQDYYQEGIAKKNIILSVGRLFSGLYNNKRYDIMTEAFRKLYDSGLKTWQYHIIGSAANDEASQKMIRDLKLINQGYPIIFHINESFDILKRSYNEASIFWHGAGYGIDENNNPENVEHFGMTTVEAMSAKCIPLAVRRGGQTEILECSPVNLFWDSIDDLVCLTTKLINEPSNLNSLQEFARKRYYHYSIFEFERNTSDTFHDLLKN